MILLAGRRPPRVPGTLTVSRTSVLLQQVSRNSGESGITQRGGGGGEQRQRPVDLYFLRHQSQHCGRGWTATGSPRGRHPPAVPFPLSSKCGLSGSRLRPTLPSNHSNPSAGICLSGPVERRLAHCKSACFVFALFPMTMGDETV